MTSITVTGGTFYGAHFGDNIYNIYVSGATSDEPFDFDGYANLLRERLHREAASHVPLDVEPMVTSRDRVVPQSLEEALAAERRAIIVAPTGAGKTASLRYATTCGDSSEIRVYVELARYRKSPALSDLDCLLILVGEVVTDWAAAAKPPSIETLRRLLRERTVTLLFDGLNEVDASIRPWCLRAIRDLAFAFEGCRVVFSTRPHAFTPMEGWTTLRLCELSNDQIVRFVHAYADDTAATAVLERLEENSLLRLPLFLRFALRLAHRVETPMHLPVSRVAIVDAYVNELFRDERQPIRDAELLNRVLARLASAHQMAGQAIPLQDARRLLGDHDAELLPELAACGFLQIDSRYVRFWHHTIQEYFYAREQQRVLATSNPLVRRWRMRRELARRADEDALTFLPVHATDREVGTLMRVAAHRNITLAARWADDLAIDGRAGASVLFFLQAAKKRLRTAKLYSRITYARRPVMVGALLGVDVLFMWGAIDVLQRTRPWSSVSPPWVLPFVIAIVLLHYLWRYRGCPDAAQLAGAARAARGIVRDRLTEAFAAIPRSIFSSYALRQIALMVVHAERRSGDPLRDLETSPTPYVTIQLLGFEESPRALAVLEAVIEAARNVYARAALLAMLERASRDRRAADRLLTGAAAIWNRRGGWRLRRTAGRCLAVLDPSFRLRYRVVVILRRALLTFAFALYFGVFVIFFSGMEQVLRAARPRIDPTGALLLFLLILVPVVAILMAACAALLGSKRIHGYHGIDAWPWWAYLIWAPIVSVLTSPIIPTGIFLFQVLDIDRNARGLDLRRVRQIVENASHEQI